MASRLSLGSASHPSPVWITSLAIGARFYVPDAEHHYDAVIYQKIARPSSGWTSQPDSVIAWVHPRVSALTGWQIGHTFGLGESVSVVPVQDDCGYSVG